MVGTYPEFIGTCFNCGGEDLRFNCESGELIEWPEDVETLYKYYNSKSYTMSIEDCIELWQAWSNQADAGWLVLPDVDLKKLGNHNKHLEEAYDYWTRGRKWK